MRTDDAEFRRVLEDIKLRAPIEEIVGERVNLVQRGRLYWACCPFHDEKTPSFKIDPEQGNWYCFGACRKGGDVLSFLQQADGVTFMDAVEILAARVGVALPKRRHERHGGSGGGANDGGLGALAFADEWFQRQLAGPGGREAREYLVRRRISEDAVRAFGLGFAPTGRGLLEAAASAKVALADLERAGLVRRGEDGGHYSFFRGRLVIPIRDLAGHTVAFGARRLADGEAAGPKYINSAESDYFHKGRIVYALDRALEAVRRASHLVLVEGYTDVIAAHQAGVPIVCAVLGTATTSDHAELLRRAGARRISLVFDGDEAGRQAAYRGLEGLLGLDAELEVVVLPGGQDPADVLSASNGAAAFRAHLDAGLPWIDFVAQGLIGLAGRELSRETDRALGLVLHLKRPVERESALRQLAAKCGLPLETLREQLATLPRRRAALRNPPGQTERESSGPADEGHAARASAENSVAALDPRVIRAYEGLVGATLVDPTLCPRVREWAARCPVPELARILAALLALWDDEDLDEALPIEPSAVMNALGADPARQFVIGLAEHARSSDGPAALLEGEVRFLERYEREREFRRLEQRLGELSRPGSGSTGDSLSSSERDRLIHQMTELRRAGARLH